MRQAVLEGTGWIVCSAVASVEDPGRRGRRLDGDATDRQTDNVSRPAAAAKYDRTVHQRV